MTPTVRQGRRVLKPRGIPLENEGSYVIKCGLYYLQRDSSDVFAGKALARRFVSRESAERHLKSDEAKFNTQERVGRVSIVHLLPRGTIARRERRTIREAIKRVIAKHEEALEKYGGGLDGGEIRWWFERLIEELS